MRALHRFISVFSIGTLILLMSCGDSKTTPPAVTLTGSWTITETITTATSPCTEGLEYTYTASFVQTGNDLTITVTVGSITGGPDTGTAFTGTISGKTVDWSGNYLDQNFPAATITISGTTITATSTTLTGTVDWTETDGTDTCTGGKITLTATKV